MRTALLTIEAPEPFITLEDAKEHLRVDSGDEDSLIRALIGAACAHLDGPDGLLKRAIGEQSLKLVLPGFWACDGDDRIMLPLPPAVDVTEVRYFDGLNVEQTLSAADYVVFDCGTAVSYVKPSFGKSWPVTSCRDDAVSISYVAGFEDEDDIPSGIVAAVKLMIGDMYKNRESQGDAASFAENPTLKALLWPWRLIHL